MVVLHWGMQILLPRGNFVADVISDAALRLDNLVAVEVQVVGCQAGVFVGDCSRLFFLLPLGMFFSAC